MPFDPPATIDEKTRSVELIASTGAGVSRFDIDGPYIEVLEISPAAVDLSRLGVAPLLDAHRQDSLDRVLGAVTAARVEAGQLIVKVTVSERAEAIWRDIKAGIIRSVSIGYEPVEVIDDVNAQGRRVRKLTRWRLLEVSLVAVGADPDAKTRTHEVTMTNTTAAAPPAATTTRAAVNSEIRALAETFGMDSAFANGLTDREATVDEARAAILDEIGKRQSRAPRVTLVADHDAPEARIARMGEALHARHNPRVKPSDAARPYMGHTVLDIARDCLRAAGVSTTAMSAADTITRAMHGTSDFPAIFADTANRSLRAAYEAAPAVLKRVARQTTARDFRAKTTVQLGEAPTLSKVNEHGEYKYGTLAEASEAYKIDTFGRIIALSRKAIVNDDLGAFNDTAGKLGASAAEFEAQFLTDLLTSGSGNGPTMGDGKALFHADHGNKAASAAAPGLASLTAARLAMRRQKGLAGKPINVTPRFVIAPPELETSLEKLLAETQPSTADDVNPFGGRLELLVEARLTDAKRWYLAADPAVIEGLEYAYLAGSEGPQIETRSGFEVDGLEIKVRLDFGAAFLDYRGWQMDPGL